MSLALAVLGLCYCVGLALDAVSGVAASSFEVRTLWFSLLRLLWLWTQAPGHPASRGCGSQARERRLRSCSTRAEVCLSTWGRPGSGLNPCLPHWQVDPI